jgi:fibronectin-binding autotransporter adhesin
MGGGSISNNTAGGARGGLFIPGSTATVVLTNVSVMDNDAATAGGGIEVLAGKFTMHGGTLGANTATSGNGGGLDNAGGTVLLDQSRMVGGNNAGANGGGLFVNNLSPMTTLNGLTVQGNTATNGKGIYWQNGGGDNLSWTGLTDKDDPNGAPVQGP